MDLPQLRYSVYFLRLNYQTIVLITVPTCQFSCLVWFLSSLRYLFILNHSGFSEVFEHSGFLKVSSGDGHLQKVICFICHSSYPYSFYRHLQESIHQTTNQIDLKKKNSSSGLNQRNISFDNSFTPSS